MTKTFLTKLMQHSLLLAIVLSMGWLATPSKALPVCSDPGFATPTPISSAKVFPGICDGTDPGTFEGSMSSSWALTGGTAHGKLISAVFKESGGTLDFYYQIFVDPSSTGVVERNTDINFTGFTTGTAFRTDCGTIVCGGGLVNGEVAPVTADRKTADSVGFDFTFPSLNESGGPPTQISNVLIITTNATSFNSKGAASLIDGTTAGTSAFQPTSGVPEPMSFMLLGSGLLCLGLLRKSKKA